MCACAYRVCDTGQSKNDRGQHERDSFSFLHSSPHSFLLPYPSFVKPKCSTLAWCFLVNVTRANVHSTYVYYSLNFSTFINPFFHTTPPFIIPAFYPFSLFSIFPLFFFSSFCASFYFFLHCCNTFSPLIFISLPQQPLFSLLSFHLFSPNLLA